MYLRPGIDKDVNGIVSIYNYWAINCIIPEDQEHIQVSDMLVFMQYLKNQKLPFIVAIKGRAPLLQDAQGRRGTSQKANLPKAETIIGTCFAERYSQGIGGTHLGRSRGTVCLQLYVHPEYTRKGVGRNLLDRMVHCLTPARAFRNAHEWLNPDNDKIHEAGGSGLWHQMLFQVPVKKKEDPDFGWIAQFLYQRFMFKEEGRMKSVARSRNYGFDTEWLDLVMCESPLSSLFTY